ncbi:MAG: hypothetical protein H7Y00_03930, partial [Fimbriimonadaceae bacterium]|nr:hypothetical protein [Chitinophagales bacterium]
IEAINWLGGDSIIIFSILNATAITNEMTPVYLDASSYSAIIAGMDEQEMNEINLKIFPNPVSGDEIKIICNENLYNAYWKITDITGKIICKGLVINNTIIIPDEIQLSNQEYVLSITNDVHFINHPFIYFKN